MNRRAACFAILLFAVANARADTRADKILADSAAKVSALKSLGGTMQTTLKFGSATVNSNYQTLFARPNFARLEKRQDGKSAGLQVSDGAKFYFLLPSNEYKESALPADPRSPGMPTGSVLGRFFFNPRFGVLAFPTRTTKYIGKESVAGVNADVVEIRHTAIPARNVPEQTIRLWIGADGIPRRSRLVTDVQGRSLTADAVFANIRTNMSASPKLFAFVPPPGAKKILSREEALYEGMLPLGKPAPSFILLTSKGDSFSLTDSLKANRVTLVNFWFLGCPPCRAEFPALQSLYARLKSKGLGIVAVNVARDPDKAVNAYFKSEKLTFPTVTDTISKDSVGQKWGVTSTPSTYLLDAKGNVIYRAVGFDESGLKNALAKAGLL